MTNTNINAAEANTHTATIADRTAVLTVGQKLWYVPFGGGSPRYVTVTAVGRKWATLDAGRPLYRIDIETLTVDGRGYSTPGRCHLSRETYEEDRHLRDAWHEIARRMNHPEPPAGVGLEQIRQIAEICGLTEYLPERKSEE